MSPSRTSWSTIRPAERRRAGRGSVVGSGRGRGRARLMSLVSGGTAVVRLFVSPRGAAKRWTDRLAPPRGETSPGGSGSRRGEQRLVERGQERGEEVVQGRVLAGGHVRLPAADDVELVQ